MGTAGREAASHPIRTIVEARRHGAHVVAGLLPHGDTTRPGGLGLWLTHQLCDHVVLDRDDDGFTIRLSAVDS